jgi:aminoglycoside 3-N-acetyltransferase
MVGYRELVNRFQLLGIDPHSPVMVHASNAVFERVQGEVDTVLGVLLSSFSAVVVPTFTLRTLVIPEVGPQGNGMVYGSGGKANLNADFFRPSIPADASMGILAEAVRQHPHAQRTPHPALSFSGVNAQLYLETQSLEQPLAPVGALVDAGGWILLWGSDHTANISLHWAERLSGRKQFIRWALTSKEVVECPAFPGCSQGFNALAPRLEGITRRVRVGQALLLGIPAKPLIEITVNLLEQDPLSLLCSRPTCACCQAVRQEVSNHQN